MGHKASFYGHQVAGRTARRMVIAVAGRATEAAYFEALGRTCSPSAG